MSVQDAELATLVQHVVQPAETPVSPTPRKRRRQRSGSRKGWKRRPPVIVPKWAPQVRALLDRRSLACRQFEAVVEQLRLDLGGDLSAIQLGLVEAYSGLSLQLDVLNTKFLMGDPIDQTVYCSIVAAMVRVGARLGVKRKPKDITASSLSSYLTNPEKPEPAEQFPHEGTGRPVGRPGGGGSKAPALKGEVPDLGAYLRDKADVTNSHEPEVEPAAGADSHEDLDKGEE